VECEEGGQFVCFLGVLGDFNLLFGFVDSFKRCLWQVCR
jgi:hypothetical protein